MQGVELIRPALWVVAILGAGVLLDRLLLRLEAAGWINYRRRGLSRGGATYHLLGLHSIFDPAAKPMIEVSYRQQQEADESGAPPGAKEDEGASTDAGTGPAENGVANGGGALHERGGAS